MAKGFGVKTPRKKSKRAYPLVVSLEQKLQSGELVSGQSSTWDWMESLTGEENARFTTLRDSNSVPAKEELILLVVHLQAMETGDTNISLSEDLIVKQVSVLVFMGALKELIDARLVETEDFPRRLVDSDRSMNVRLVKEV